MFTNFGDIELESSRAFLEEEDEEDDISPSVYGGDVWTETKSRTPIPDQVFESLIIQAGASYKLYFLDDNESDDELETFNDELDIETYLGETYEAFVGENKRCAPSNLFCIFSGRVPVGFGKGYLGKSVESLAKIYYTGGQGTVDSLLVRPKSKLVVEVVKAGENLIFGLIDTYAVSTSVVNAICAELKIFIEVSHHVVIFHSEGVANFRSEPDNLIEEKIFYIRNQIYQKVEIPSIAKRCPSPNLLSGISATVLTQCQQNYKKPCLVLVNYAASETVNHFTLKPFFDTVQGVLSASADFHISTYFSELKFNLTSTGSSIPTYISQSNLYI